MTRALLDCPHAMVTDLTHTLYTKKPTQTRPRTYQARTAHGTKSTKAFFMPCSHCWNRGGAASTISWLPTCRRW
jgi:hypothetical protein